MAHDEKIQPTDETTAAQNPAGDVLSDDDLDVVAGGTYSQNDAMATEGVGTWGCCTGDFCP